MADRSKLDTDTGRYRPGSSWATLTGLAAAQRATPHESHRLSAVYRRFRDPSATAPNARVPDAELDDAGSRVRTYGVWYVSNSNLAPSEA